MLIFLLERPCILTKKPGVVQSLLPRCFNQSDWSLIGVTSDASIGVNSDASIGVNLFAFSIDTVYRKE